jgi:hypothetical protein
MLQHVALNGQKNSLLLLLTIRLQINLYTCIGIQMNIVRQ